VNDRARLEEYQRMLKYFKQDQWETRGFCYYVKYILLEEDERTKEMFPELWARRTSIIPTYCYPTEFNWFAGRHERISALRSSIRELKWKLFINRFKVWQKRK